MKFDNYRWINSHDGIFVDSYVRKSMAQYLENNNILIGKSKHEVIEMLGESEDFSDIPSNELYYTLECDYGYDIDPVKIEYLIVILDSKDHVTQTYRKVTLDK